MTNCYPKTLEECMREVQLVNHRNLALKLAFNEWGVHGPRKKEAQGQANNKSTNTQPEETRQDGRETYMRQIKIPNRGNYAKREPPVKRLFDGEFRVHLDKGLCFRYNEKYSPTHRCKGKENRELMLFIFYNDEETEEVEEAEGEEAETLELKRMEIIEETEISLCTINGFLERGLLS